MALTFHGEQSDRSDALLREWSVDRCHVRKKGMEGKLCHERHGFDHHRRNSPVLPQSVWRSVPNVMVTWCGCLVFDGQRHCLCVFVHSRLVPVLGWLYHRVPLPGCVQVGEYDLEKKNSWLIFNRVGALVLSMMIVG